MVLDPVVHVFEGRADYCRLHAHEVGAPGPGLRHWDPDDCGRGVYYPDDFGSGLHLLYTGLFLLAVMVFDDSRIVWGADG